MSRLIHFTIGLCIFSLSLFGDVGLLKTIDFSDPEQTKQYSISNIETFIVNGENFYIATAYPSNIALYDKNVTKQKDVNLTSVPKYLDFDQGYLYVATQNGIEIFDENLTKKTTQAFDTQSNILQLIANSEILYVLQDGKIVIYKLREDRSSATELSEISLVDPQSIAYIDGILYVADGIDGLKGIDVENPSVPKRITKLEGEYKSVSIEGSRLVTIFNDANDNLTLSIYDITDASLALFLSSFSLANTYGSSTGVITDLYSGYFCIGYDSYFSLFDVNDPLNIVQIVSNLNVAGEQIRKLIMRKGLNKGQ